MLEHRKDDTHELSTFGAHTGVDFARRAQRWCMWDLIPNTESQSRNFRTAVSIPLVGPGEDNFGDIKGMQVTGIRGNIGVVYSSDMRG